MAYSILENSSAAKNEFENIGPDSPSKVLRNVDVVSNLFFPPLRRGQWPRSRLGERRWGAEGRRKGAVRGKVPGKRLSHNPRSVHHPKRPLPVPGEPHASPSALRTMVPCPARGAYE